MTDVLYKLFCKGFLNKKNIVSTFGKFVGRTSDNHVTVGHVSFRETSSTPFGQLTAPREEPFSFVSALQETCACKLSSENFCTPCKRECSSVAIQHLFLGTAFVNRFMV